MTAGAAPSKGMFAVALLTATLWQGATPAAVEAYQSGLSYTTVGTWRPDMDAGRVHVTLRVTATSHASDYGSRRYYFPGLQLTLPASSEGFEATDDRGQALPVKVMASSPYGVVVYATFRERLYAGESGSFNFAFDLVDTGGSTDRDLHIGRDVASFPVVAFGSPDTPGSSVTVVFPAGYSIQEPFGNLTSRAGVGGETIYSSGLVSDATAVNAWFTASLFEPSADHEVRYVTVAPLQVALRYWADDPSWADQVEQILLAGYPVLRELIGRGDPRIRSLTLEESTARGIGGFSGEYDRGAGQVKISYFADPMTILHELAHMWFDDILASDRWINEGFASYYAEQAILRLGLPDHAPQLSGALMAAAVPLNDWVERGDPGSAREAYLYAASLQAAREMAQIVGQGKLRQVWTWSRSGADAYDEPPPAVVPQAPGAGGGPSANSSPSIDPSATPAASPTSAAGAFATPVAPGPVGPIAPALDWRRLLDYLDQASGASLDEVWQRWVVTPEQARELAQRAVALDDYRLTRTLAGDWQMPPDVRLAMANWQFEPAEQLLAETRAVLAMRNEIRALAAVEGTTPPPTMRLAFEEVATDSARSEATDELAALSELTAARRARTSSDDAARMVGLLGADPDAQLAAARTAFAAGDLDGAARLAAAARSAWTGAAGSGQVRLFGAAVSLAGLLLLLTLHLYRRRAEEPAEEGEADDGR
jgi:hypothetical protein